MVDGLSGKRTARSRNFCQPLAGSKRLSSRLTAGISSLKRTDIGVKLGILDILNAFPFYLMVIDADHYIIEANEAVYKQLGIRREDIMGRYCPWIIHGVRHPFHGCPLEEAVEKNSAVERELFDEKSKRWVISSIYPINGVELDGKKVYLHMMTDITDRKQAEQKLQASHEQLRILSAHMESVREEEKRKIARDLHDETSQLLASLNAYLEAAIKTLPDDANNVQTILRKAQALSVTILDDLRKLIYDLRPSLLDELGLIAAINSSSDNYLNAAGIKVSLKSMGKVKRLPASLEVAIFRAVQEALNNIVNHAHAGNVEIRVQFRKDSIRIHIKDDGIGFEVNKAIASKEWPRGLGLLGMRERLELISGSLKIKSSPGSGTDIYMKVPLYEGDGDGKDKDS